MLEGPNFLVELNGEHEFLTRMEDDLPYGCPYPSAALHMEYAAADEVCRQLREQGYLLALVTDRYGRPVSADDLQNMLRLKDKQLYSVAFRTGTDELDKADLWFIKREAGQIIGAEDRRRALRCFLPVAAAIAEDLRQLGYKAAEVKVYGDPNMVLSVSNEEDVRQTEAYREAMGPPEPKPEQSKSRKKLVGASR